MSVENVRRWKACGNETEPQRCAAVPPPGVPKLTGAQVEQVRTALEQSARAHGFEADLWTLERVGHVVECITGGSRRRPRCGGC